MVHYYFFLLLYIKNLLGNLEANVKLFVDDTSVASIVSDPINISQKLNKNLDKFGLWSNKWKMSVNPDPSKQVHQVIFLREITKVYQLSTQKHFGIHLDKELSLKHINGKINKANNGIRIIRKLNNILPCHALLTIYRYFVRPDLDYGDVT